MTKKIFKRVLPLLLVVCMLLSTTAFAATTYYIEVSLTGPDANGVTQTVSGASSKYGSLSTPLAYEVVQLLNAKLDTIREVFALTGLSQIVYSGLDAFNAGEAAWQAYTGSYYGDVNGSFKDTLSDLDSTFADVPVNVPNVLTYQTDKGTTYTVTVTLKQHGTGGSTAQPGETDDYICLPYVDIDLSAWYHEGVHYCLTHDIMNGYSGTVFGPNDTLTRAQVAQIIYNLEDRPAVDNEDPFVDVAPYNWYAKAVTWAAEVGVVNGTGSSKFRPDDPITREQLAAMLYRYSQYKGYDVSAGETIDSLAFSDADTVSAWALPAVKWAYAEEIIQGMGNNLLSPDGYTTRAQAATMLMRFMLNVAEK